MQKSSSRSSNNNEAKPEEVDDDNNFDEEELEAAAEVDPDREASDAQEIEDMSDGVELSMYITDKDVLLERNALLKVSLIASYKCFNQ